ncbi:hypothetical protein [uncultured Clostridium sp.]|uniref:hypothetical protein n=1 Tax=uncultured Clostridium sp. TaxID=59620 RepID=UPI0028EAB01B|nr:hypothetical protein [uncultured Clostridium sp.]
MKNNEIIADIELLNKYEYYAWEILSELRAAEGLNHEKVKEVFEILEQMIEIYKNENQIEKLVAETFVLIPENIMAIGKIDIIEGQEIQVVANKYLEFRTLILGQKIDSKQTIVNKELIDEFKENSIGKKGFLPLIKKNNKLDMEKLKNTFKALNDMVKIYEDYHIIDKELVEIIISINFYLYEENLQTNGQISNNFVGQFQNYKRKLFEIKE